MKTKPLFSMTQSLATALWLITICTVPAQTAVEAWVQRYGNLVDGDDRASALAVDDNGNVVVTGSSYRGPSALDCTTIKYSGAGVPLWTNRYDTGNWGPAAVAVDGNGNVFVTGYSASDNSYAIVAYSSAGALLWKESYNAIVLAAAVAVDGTGNVFVTGSSDSNGYATLKYSGAGVPLWTNRYNGPGSGDSPTAMAVDGSGNVVVTGFSYDSNGWSDYATIKYSAAGLPLWTRRYTGPGEGPDQANAVAVDAGGNVFVTGATWNASTDKYATIKYSAAGVPLWTNYYGEFAARASAVAVDSSGNVVVTGQGGQCATIKYSAAGVPVWTNRFDRPNNLPAIAVDGSGNVFVTAASGTDSFPYADDYATVAYSSAGVPLWTNRYNGPRNWHDQPTDVAVDSSGNVFVTGSSFGGLSDYVTIKYSVASLQPVPLNYQILGNQLVLSWTNAAFGLQSAPAVQGLYTDIPGATSPHTNYLSGTQWYFRLKGN